MAEITGNDIQVLEGQKKPPRARTLGFGIALGWFVFVGAYLLMWEHLPHEQTILNRISWSSGDFVGLAATGLSLYTYYLVQKSSQSKDVLYLQRFVLAFKKAGFEPEELPPLIKQVRGMTAVLREDPLTMKRIEIVAQQVLYERLQAMKKLTDVELYELFRSLGK